MVTERITDGERIAELLIAELRGRQSGTLAAVTTTTDRTAAAHVHTVCTVTESVAPRRKPAPAMVERQIARVSIYDEYVELTPLVNDKQMIDAAKTVGLLADGTIRIDNAAGVKRGVDVLEAGIAAID